MDFSITLLRPNRVSFISPLGYGQEAAWLNLIMLYAENTLGELTISGSPVGSSKLTNKSHDADGRWQRRQASILPCNAEKLVSSNGLGKLTIPHKQRSLHHCYTDMRIMAETTCIADGLSGRLTNANLSGEDEPST